MTQMEIPVLYRDEALLVCEKPVGVPSESPGLPDLVSDQEGFDVWPVHRLDQGTGGTVVLARSQDACSALQKLFQQDLVRKEYLAVVAGTPQEPAGCFEDLLFHDRKKNKSYIVSRERAGVKRAYCEFSVLGSVTDGDQALTLVRVLLHTGRTHQIRVQFGSRGFPLVGDRRYGSRIKADAPALWACSVSFPHPFRADQSVSVSSVPPPVFPWSLFSVRSL